MFEQDDVKKTKEQILNSCLEIIEQDGFEGVTVRRIAAKAGVNIALINYYFGSKEKLIDEAVRLIVSGFRESFVFLENPDLDPRQKLKRFLARFAGIMNRYHDVALRVLSKKEVFTDSQNEYVSFLKLSGLDEAKSLLRELTGEEREERLFMMILQIGGAVIGPVMLYPLAKSAFKAIPDLDEKTMDFYIDSFLDRYLH